MQKSPVMRRGISQSVIAAAAALALGAGITMAQQADRGAPPDRPAPPGDVGPGGGPGGSFDRRGGQTPVELSGIVQSYNLGPHGIPDALMIKTGDKIAQVNFPPELGILISQTPIGDQVKVKAIAGPRAGDHAVYRFISLTNSKGQQLGGTGPGSEKRVNMQGVVKQINYTRDGEIDGAILESGDLMLVPPDSAQQLKLAVGQNLKIEGQARSNVRGVNVIHARTVNGTAIAPDDAGPAGPPDDQGPPRQRGRDHGDSGGDNGPPPRRTGRPGDGPDAGGPPDAADR